MSFLRRHRVPVVLVALAVVVVVLAGYRIKKQQAAAVPRRQFEVVVGGVKPIVKDLDVKLAYTADVLPLQQVSVFAKVTGYIKRLGADLGDFVKEDRAQVSCLHLSRLVAIRTCKTAFDMPEQLGLEQRFRQAGAVHGRKDVVCTRTARMDAAGDDFFSDAALPSDQYLRIGAGDAVDFLLQCQDFRAAANEFHVGLHAHTRERIRAPVRADRCHRHAWLRVIGRSLRVLMGNDNERRSREWLPVRTGTGARLSELLQSRW